MLFLALPARKIQGLNPKIDLLGRKVGLNYQNDGSLTCLDTEHDPYRVEDEKPGVEPVPTGAVLLRHQETQVQLGMPQSDRDRLFVFELTKDIVGMSRRLFFQSLHDSPKTCQALVG